MTNKVEVDFDRRSSELRSPASGSKVREPKLKSKVSKNRTSVRCVAINKNGQRCLNMTRSENRKCTIHNRDNRDNRNNRDQPERPKAELRPHKSVPNIKTKKEEPRTCSICWEKIDERPLKCGHHAHESCLRKSMKAECPICRLPLTLSKRAMKEIEGNLESAKREWERENEREIINEYISALSQMRFEIMAPEPLCDECLNFDEFVQNLSFRL